PHRVGAGLRACGHARQDRSRAGGRRPRLRALRRGAHAGVARGGLGRRALYRDRGSGLDGDPVLVPQPGAAQPVPPPPDRRPPPRAAPSGGPLSSVLWSATAALVALGAWLAVAPGLLALAILAGTRFISPARR